MSEPAEERCPTPAECPTCGSTNPYHYGRNCLKHADGWHRANWHSAKVAPEPSTPPRKTAANYSDKFMQTPPYPSGEPSPSPSPNWHDRIENGKLVYGGESQPRAEGQTARDCPPNAYEQGWIAADDAAHAYLDSIGAPRDGKGLYLRIEAYTSSLREQLKLVREQRDLAQDEADRFKGELEQARQALMQLADLWDRQSASYPNTDRGVAAKSAVRLCAQELRAEAMAGRKGE